MKVSLIIPTKNEPAIDKIIKDCFNVLGKNAEILVVDKSTDDTPKKAKEAGARVIYQKGAGYGDAYKVGFNHAAGDIVLMIDADMTYDPRFFPKLIKPLVNDEADFVLGNRFANMHKRAMSRANKLGNKLLTWLLNKLYKLDIQDSQSGMRAIKKTALDKLSLSDPGMPLASEMLIEACKKGLRIAEVPITYKSRVGETKQNVYNGVRIAITTIRLIRDYNPLLLFGLVSLLFLVPGVGLGVSIIHEWLVTGIITRLGSVVFSSLLVLTGVFLFCMGLMIDLLVKEVRRVR